jgi:hypothetical protein
MPIFQIRGFVIDHHSLALIPSLRQRQTAWGNRPSGRQLQATSPAGFNHDLQYGFTLACSNQSIDLF